MGACTSSPVPDEIQQLPKKTIRNSKYECRELKVLENDFDEGKMSCISQDMGELWDDSDDEC